MERYATLPEENYDPVSHEGENVAPPTPDLMAINTGVRLACTMAAMMGLFAVFLCWVEHQSRVIRRFAVQSAAMTALHAVVGIGLLLLGTLMAGIPYIGFMVTMLCWLVYISLLIVLVVFRVQLMKSAWLGVRYDLPKPIELLLDRYY